MSVDWDKAVVPSLTFWPTDGGNLLDGSLASTWSITAIAPAPGPSINVTIPFPDAYQIDSIRISWWGNSAWNSLAAKTYRIFASAGDGNIVGDFSTLCDQTTTGPTGCSVLFGDFSTSKTFGTDTRDRIDNFPARGSRTLSENKFNRHRIFNGIRIQLLSPLEESIQPQYSEYRFREIEVFGTRAIRITEPHANVTWRVGSAITIRWAIATMMKYKPNLGAREPSTLSIQLMRTAVVGWTKLVGTPEAAQQLFSGTLPINILCESDQKKSEGENKTHRYNHVYRWR